MYFYHQQRLHIVLQIKALLFIRIYSFDILNSHDRAKIRIYITYRDKINLYLYRLQY